MDYNELVDFDIVMHFTPEGNLVYTNAELSEVFQTLLKEQGEFIIKVNWFSPHLVLLAPNGDNNKMDKVRKQLDESETN